MDWQMPLPGGADALGYQVVLTAHVELVQQGLTMIVLGLAGSLRRGSYNRRLLQAAAGALPPGAHLVAFEDLADIPAYNDDERGGEAVTALRDAISAADAVLIATPEYNASVPGQLKNALNWASSPFPDNVLHRKPVAVIGASTGLFGAVWVQAELRKILTTIGAAALDRELAVGLADDAFDSGDNLVDPDLNSALADIVRQLVATAQVAA